MEPTELNTELKFETPQIVDHGDLAELTAGQQAGNFTDATFPAGTPFADLTFSN